jgi:hypothetical protein
LLSVGSLSALYRMIILWRQCNTCLSIASLFQFLTRGVFFGSSRSTSIHLLVVCLEVSCNRLCGIFLEMRLLTICWGCPAYCSVWNWTTVDMRGLSGCVKQSDGCVLCRELM